MTTAPPAPAPVVSVPVRTPQFSLTPAQSALHAGFRVFVDREVAPLAERHDREQSLDRALVGVLAGEGLLAAQVPAADGGRGLDPVSYALLHEEMGRGCSSVRSLLTVHDMVAECVRRFGSPALRGRWLPRLVTGRALGAFALTERESGSDASAVATRAEPAGEGGYRLSGVKCWVTFGELADVFLVFARTGQGVTAFLVESDRPGVMVRPVRDMLGIRGAMNAEVEFADVFVPADNIVGGPGRAHPFVVTHALTLGRLSVACGSVGIVRASSDEAVSYASARGTMRHQLVQRMVADQVVAARAGRLLALAAAEAIWARRADAPMAATEAKYFCSRAAADAARDAVQVTGAVGCSPGGVAGRLYRDAKVMEIIEGSHEVSQQMIAMFGHGDRGAAA